MEQQPWNQQREGGGGYAMGESSCYGADLMELIMEDQPSSDSLLLDGDDVDRQLSHVIRSLEAEIGGDEAAVMMTADEGSESRLFRIEDVLPDDMDGYGYEGASSPFLAGHDDEAEGWCVYTNTNVYYEGGSVLGYDTVDHHYYYCSAEGSAAEDMYLPLWE